MVVWVLQLWSGRVSLPQLLVVVVVVVVVVVIVEEHASPNLRQLQQEVEGELFQL